MKPKLYYAKYVLAAVVEFPIGAKTLKEAALQAVKLKTLNSPLVLQGLNTVYCIGIRKVGKHG